MRSVADYWLQIADHFLALLDKSSKPNDDSPASQWKLHIAVLVALGCARTEGARTRQVYPEHFEHLVELAKRCVDGHSTSCAEGLGYASVVLS